MPLPALACGNLSCKYGYLARSNAAQQRRLHLLKRVAEPIAAAIALGQSLGEHGHDGLKLVSKHVGRIKHENRRCRQSEPGEGRANGKSDVEKLESGRRCDVCEEAVGRHFILQKHNFSVARIESMIVSRLSIRSRTPSV